MPNHTRLPAIRMQIQNRILLALPEPDLRRILPLLTFERLSLGRVLYDGDSFIDHAYFINSGMVSSVTVTAEGEALEFGAVGSGGVLGIQEALGENRVFCSSVVQIPGNAMRIRPEALMHELRYNAGLGGLLSNYLLEAHLLSDQSKICRQSHSVEQRLCRWLLTSQDCARTDSFPISREFLSHVVGATRATIAQITSTLQEAGLISFLRISVRVIDRPGLRTKSCECYQLSSESCLRQSAA